MKILKIKILYIFLIAFALILVGQNNAIPQTETASNFQTINDTSQAIFNANKLSHWNKWKANPSSRFDWVLIGDSYTQGDYYSPSLYKKLIAHGFADGGPGYCSFNRWDPKESYSIDQSIDTAQLKCGYNLRNWAYENQHTPGPCGYITSRVKGSAINVTSSVMLNQLVLIYERHPSAGSFKYSINGGAGITVHASAVKRSIGKVIIDVAGKGPGVILRIVSLKAGQVFCGVLGRRAGNVLNVHKLGSSGATADVFAQNALWRSSVQLLTPKAAAIMFGTNEMIENISPVQFKVNIQNIINTLKAINPQCDILIMSPPQTKHEHEEPRKYKLADYTAVLQQLAIANNATYISFSKLFGPFSQVSVDDGLMAADRIHPGLKGGELISNTIYKVLTAKN